MDNDIVRCEGWRRYSVFTLGGTTKWRQCENNAIVIVTAVQDDKTEDMPACMICWKEGVEKNIQINKVTPI